MEFQKKKSSQKSEAFTVNVPYRTFTLFISYVKDSKYCTNSVIGVYYI